MSGASVAAVDGLLRAELIVTRVRPAHARHARTRVAPLSLGSAVIAPCARPCLHICPPEVTARPSVTASSLACAQAFGNGPRRKAAAVGGERAIHGIARRELLCAVRVAGCDDGGDGSAIEVAYGCPAQAPAAALAVPSRARTLLRAASDVHVE